MLIDIFYVHVMDRLFIELEQQPQCVVFCFAACHLGCLGSCSGPDSTDCGSCREGYVHDEEQGCLGKFLCLFVFDV